MEMVRSAQFKEGISNSKTVIFLLIQHTCIYIYTVIGARARNHLYNQQYI